MYMYTYMYMYIPAKQLKSTMYIVVQCAFRVAKCTHTVPMNFYWWHKHLWWPLSSTKQSLLKCVSKGDIHVHVQLHVYMYTCTCMYTYTHTHIHTHTHTHTHMYSTDMHVELHVHIQCACKKKSFLQVIWENVHVDLCPSVNGSYMCYTARLLSQKEQCLRKESRLWGNTGLPV